jgi:hypothetical protein
MFHKDTQKMFQPSNMPADWKLLKFEDCLGQFAQYTDKQGCNQVGSGQ